MSFITYTKGADQWVTSSQYETQFLDWLNSVDNSSSYKREVCTLVAVKCSPIIVHAVEKKEATILTLVKNNE